MSDGTDQTTELPPPGDQRPDTPEARTVQLPAAEPPAIRPQPVALIFLAVAAASFLVGIAIASATRPQRDETVVASDVVGPAGKTIRFVGGHIDVPRGAVTETVRIVVRRSTVNDRIRVESTLVPPGRLIAYSFEPTDLEFREPVELVFDLPDDARNAAVFARRDSTVVLLSGTVDPDTGTATTLVRDFRFERSDR